MVTLYLVTTIVHVDFIGLGKRIHSGEMCYLLSNPYNMTTNVINTIMMTIVRIVLCLTTS